MTTTLQKFIQSLDLKTLPRILQIQSGFYHGGSLYELCGNECSLSTGDILKITGCRVKNVLAHLFTSNEYDMLPTMELPPDFPGLFRVVADKDPYHSVEEIVQTLHIGPTQFGHPCLYSSSVLHVGDVAIEKGTNIMFHSVDKVNGAMSAKCKVILEGTLYSFSLPLSYTGEFFECQDERIYTLKEILDWKIQNNRARTVILTDIMEIGDNKKIYNAFINGMMILSPIYEIQAQMQFGGALNLLSDLDVEVLDITEHFNTKSFTEILATQDVFEKTTDEFPFIAEIVEGPIKCCKSYTFLHGGKKIIVYRKYQADRVVASEIRTDTPSRHFLIPANYKGKFKRRPRFFQTVYDLTIAKLEMAELQVVATKPFHSLHKEFSSVCVGDMFQVKRSRSCEIMHEGKQTVVDVLDCTKMEAKSNGIITLPLYVEGGFIEVVRDDKQYYLSELCKHFTLPLNVKVSVRDLFTIGEDVLANTSVLKLEEQITDSYLLVSLYDNPEEVWELPVFRLNLSFQVLGHFKGKVFTVPTRTNTEEINEEEYYMARRYENNFQAPPPRPPKTPLYVNEAERNRMQEMLLKDDVSKEKENLQDNSHEYSLPAGNWTDTDIKSTAKHNKETARFSPVNSPEYWRDCVQIIDPSFRFGHLMVSGEFNFCMDPSMDTSTGHARNPKSHLNTVRRMLHGLHLVDVRESTSPHSTYQTLTLKRERLRELLESDTKRAFDARNKKFYVQVMLIPSTPPPHSVQNRYLPTSLSFPSRVKTQLATLATAPYD
ncbi:PREDICTED: protein THEMIS [Nanorana parkeri]|uniref:protein THEMIS n=1 Tax=Nanorana parkeri TaxID=125878 RepID=UPI0008550127|nr:PREDICTED: protein THEMIS [Nanorana parkeri]